jgi:hypothetical protein
VFRVVIVPVDVTLRLFESLIDATVYEPLMLEVPTPFRDIMAPSWGAPWAIEVTAVMLLPGGRVVTEVPKAKPLGGKEPV